MDRRNETEAETDVPRVVYDGECPVCRTFVGRIDMDGGFEKIDARKESAERDIVTGSGCSLDEGMAVLHEGKVHHGKDAVAFMAARAKRNSTTNVLTRLFFGGPMRARFFYPVARLFRNTLLRLLGKRRIGA
jgi:predicted DCC family thiol-disulfide oxidoreductase YuxK